MSLHPPEPPDVESADPILELRNLHAAYYGGIQILQGLDLKVREGCITGVVGPNGAGKSTALKVVFGFLRPTLGEVILEGERINNRTAHELISRRVAYVPAESQRVRRIVRRGQPEARLLAVSKGSGPDRPSRRQGLRDVPGAGREARGEGRDPERRAATASGDCPRARPGAEAHSARRADRDDRTAHFAGNLPVSLDPAGPRHHGASRGSERAAVRGGVRLPVCAGFGSNPGHRATARNFTTTSS